MPACTKKLHFEEVAGGATLSLGTQTKGSTADYKTTILIESDVTPPGTRVFPHLSTANTTRSLTVPTAPHGTGLRFRTTFLSTAAITVTLVVNGAKKPLSCDISGKKGDKVDVRFFALKSV